MPLMWCLCFVMIGGSEYIRKIRKLDLKIDCLMPGGRIAFELQRGGSKR